ncbi:MAG: hypothetical protein FH758_08195 [Firmicutes bacterium]|nr:hypothetical protein [Bacillota bacterium]
MSNKIEQEINKIEIPKELNERSKLGVLKAKSEKQRSRKSFNLKVIAVAASLVLSIGTFAIYNNFNQNNTTPNQNTLIVNENGSVVIPKIQLPRDASSASMIGLIVFNEKIYTQTRTEVDAEDAKALLGEKLGTTKGTIDEWSKQEAYDEEFASTIGKADVYAVKGYDKDFRIMTYEEREGKFYAAFYESLNGITVHDGKDVFGKLKMTGNIAIAQYRFYSDWNNSIDNYHPIRDMNVLEAFIENLNEARPFPRNKNEPLSEESRNDEEYRELIVHLNDGSKVSLTLLKGGYIYYGHMAVYFKMDEDQFSRMWNQLQ